MMYFIQVFPAALFNCFHYLPFGRENFNFIWVWKINCLKIKNSPAAGAIEEYCVPNMTCATSGVTILRTLQVELCCENDIGM